MISTSLDIEQLSTDERISLIERLWDSLQSTPSVLSQKQRALLIARDEELERDIAAGRPLGTPWSEIRASLEKRGK